MTVEDNCVKHWPNKFDLEKFVRSPTKMAAARAAETSGHGLKTGWIFYQLSTCLHGIYLD